ncbi:MAG TPA: response regulator transcription factor [Solirubrobacteraceae bacterium]|nr:response regulator transcription factor [Solirubrobacteraceae bacterium]
MQRLVVAADNSLILEAISIGLRHSGEFRMLGHVDVRTASWRAIVDAAPDVVLIDDMNRSEEALALIRGIKSASPEIAVIVLTMDMDADWLDAVFDAGAGGAISKATHPAALATLLRETVSGHVVHRYKRLDRPPGPVAHRLSDEDSALTMRELEVLRLVAGGSTNGEIARSLWVTEQTVKFHLSNVYRKLDVGNRTEASHYAHVNGLVSPPLVVVS